jgi:hypothetical protein
MNEKPGNFTDNYNNQNKTIYNETSMIIKLPGSMIKAYASSI